MRSEPAASPSFSQPHLRRLSGARGLVRSPEVPAELCVTLSAGRCVCEQHIGPVLPKEGFRGVPTWRAVGAGISVLSGSSTRGPCPAPGSQAAVSSQLPGRQSWPSIISHPWSGGRRPHTSALSGSPEIQLQTLQIYHLPLYSGDFRFCSRKDKSREE